MSDVTSGPEPKRPWWRKRRWRIGVAVWLAWPIFYSLAGGPLAYCEARSWIDSGTWNLLYDRPFRPVHSSTGWRPFARHGEYVGYWLSLGRYHAMRQWSRVDAAPSP